MGFFEIFIVVLALICAFAGGATILALFSAGYFVLTERLRDEHPAITFVIDCVTLILLITVVSTCFVYFGQ